MRLDAEFIHIANVSGVNDASYFEDIVTSDSHRPLDHVSICVLSGLVHNFDKLLNNAVFSKNDIASFSIDSTVHVHYTAVTEMDSTDQVAVLADNYGRWLCSRGSL